METSSLNVAKSFYEQLRSHDDDHLDLEDGTQALDEENLTHTFRDVKVEDINTSDSRITVGSVVAGRGSKKGQPSKQQHGKQTYAAWAVDDEDLDEDVPASLLVENNDIGPVQRLDSLAAATGQRRTEQMARRTPSPGTHKAQWEAVKRQQRLYGDEGHPARQPHSVMRGTGLGSRRERALWRWVNTSNLDSFMRDVYDYYEGGGMWCILCANALWLL